MAGATQGQTNVLRSDVTYSRMLAETAADEAEFYRRTYARAVFAFVEATISNLLIRIDGHHNAGKSKVHITPAQDLVRRGKRVRVKDNGDVEETKNILPLLAQVRFTLAMYANVFGCRDGPQYDGGTRWVDFGKALEIRNRLAHPTCLTDLTVSDADVKTLGNADDWFVESVGRLIAESPEASQYDR